MNLERANGKQDRLPPALELEVLKILWSDDGELSVAEVQEAMKPYRPLAYTTVLTLLERLYRKGHVSRRKQGRGYSYRPVLAARRRPGSCPGPAGEGFFRQLAPTSAGPSAENHPQRDGRIVAARAGFGAAVRVQRLCRPDVPGPEGAGLIKANVPLPYSPEALEPPAAPSNPNPGTWAGPQLVPTPPQYAVV